MSEKPLVSIIVPVHNSEKYLVECLDSIMAQDFDSFEVLVVNDHSVDNSEKICLEYANKNRNIRVLNSKMNGVSAARNTGIEHAIGDWITFIDSDDIVSSDYCSALLKATGPNIDMVIARTISFKGELTNQLDDGFKADNVTDFSDYQQKKALIRSVFIDNKKSIVYPHISTCSAKLFRSSLLGKSRYDIRLDVYEDAVFNIEAIQKSRTVRLINQKIYFYRLNNCSATKCFSKEMINGYKKVHEAFRKLEKKYKIGYYECENYFVIKNLNTMAQAFYREGKDVDFICNICEQEPYASAIRNIDMSFLPRKRRVIVALIRKRKFGIASIIYRCFA